MIYKPGGKTKVWNTTAHVIVIDEADLEEYLADGWLDHPGKLFDSPEPVQRKKPGTKPKAVSDADSN
ncbi:hypothetical protein [Symbiopectobacterium sp. RP]